MDGLTKLLFLGREPMVTWWVLSEIRQSMKCLPYGGNMITMTSIVCMVAYRN